MPNVENQQQARRSARRSKPTGHVKRVVHFVLFLAACALVANALAGDQGLLALLRAQRQYDQLAADIAHQRADNARLAEEARRLRDDPTAIEEVARRELGLIRPGEKVFIVKDLPSPDKP